MFVNMPENVRKAKDAIGDALFAKIVALATGDQISDGIDPEARGWQITAIVSENSKAMAVLDYIRDNQTVRFLPSVERVKVTA